MRQEAQRLPHGFVAPLQQGLVAPALLACVAGGPQGLAGERLVQRLLQDLLHLTLVDRGHGHLLVGIGRHEQARHQRMPCSGLGQQGHAIAGGHPVVGQQHGHLVPLRGHQVQGLRGAAGGAHVELVAILAREPLERLRFVVDQQHGVRALDMPDGHRVGVHEGGLGRSKENSVHSPWTLSTDRVPPWRWTMP
jgi:hypothetical protein